VAAACYEASNAVLTISPEKSEDIW